MLQNKGKKNTKKENNVSENYLPLQRFNKQRLFYRFKKQRK